MKKNQKTPIDEQVFSVTIKGEDGEVLFETTTRDLAICCSQKDDTFNGVTVGDIDKIRGCVGGLMHRTMDALGIHNPVEFLIRGQTEC